MWTEAARAARRTMEVDLEPLREAFLASGKSAASVAKAMGWTRQKYRHRNGQRFGPYTGGDSTRLLRTLGLREQNLGHGYVGKRQRCSYEMGVRLAEAIGVDPVDVEL